MLYYMQLTLSKIYIFYFSTFFVVVAGTAVHNMDSGLHMVWVTGKIYTLLLRSNPSATG